ncbi:hypothetical protein [Frondihabitans cladoniiphilus]|uniref:hypothetical protein n=1 Tax=Frondihabitans cladoniiphilus TaxID=715785 RepID=UPI0031EB8148
MASSSAADQFEANAMPLSSQADATAPLPQSSTSGRRPGGPESADELTIDATPCNASGSTRYSDMDTPRSSLTPLQPG